MPEIVGTLVIRNANAYIVNEARQEIPLWAWLASWGLREEEIKIILERKKEGIEDERY